MGRRGGLPAPAGIRAQPPARGLRTATGVAATLGAGSAGHLVAGGSWSVPALVLATGLLAVPTWQLGRREQGWPAIAVLLLTGQVVVHACLALMHGDHGDHDAAGMALLPTGWMLVFHLAAALVAGWWLRCGERRLWRAAAALARAAGRLIHPAPRREPVAAPSPPSAVPRPLESAVILRHAIVLRAPPGRP